ncbi:MAG: hypothetical protein ACRDK0_08540 [Solirubrobacteraceae bacterium]
MISEREQSRSVHAERPPRRDLRVDQPRSTAGLRPSQRRAADRRALIEREHSVEHWLRRLARH